MHEFEDQERPRGVYERGQMGGIIVAVLYGGLAVGIVGYLVPKFQPIAFLAIVLLLGWLAFSLARSAPRWRGDSSTGTSSFLIDGDELAHRDSPPEDDGWLEKRAETKAGDGQLNDDDEDTDAR